MAHFLSLLRGINVGGKKVPMADLKAVYGSLKFKNIETYIQSGNVLFDSAETDREILSSKLEKKIASVFGFEVPVVILNQKELLEAISKNPFLKEKNIIEEKLYFTFLKEDPDKQLIKKLEIPGDTPDRFEIIGRTVYLYCPGGYGETRLSNNFFEKKLNVKGTTRNLKTCKTLLNMMEK